MLSVTTHLRERMVRRLVANAAKLSDGELTGELFEQVAEAHLVQPTFIYDFPTAISPLSKQKPDDPSLTERFELFIAGMELANGFSELNDPVRSRGRVFARKLKRGIRNRPRKWIPITFGLFPTDYLRLREKASESTAW